MRALSQEDFEHQRVLQALRQFVKESALSEKRISMMMGISLESLRPWLSGATRPRLQSLQEIKEFLEKHGPYYLEQIYPKQFPESFPNVDGKSGILSWRRDCAESEIGTWFRPWASF
jgi:transcriptional regulator with XRE-family HTH domain